MNKQNGLIPLLIVLIVALGIGAYLVFPRKNNSSPNKSTQTLAPIASNSSLPQTNKEVADWKTYIDEQYGFSFQYPPDWTIYEREGSISFKENNPSSPVSQKGMDITLYNSAGYLNFRNFLETYFYAESLVAAEGKELFIDYLKASSPQPLAVNNIPAETDALIVPHGSEGKGVWLHNGDLGIFIRSYNTSDPQNQERIFSQILNTFTLLPLKTNNNWVDVMTKGGDLYVITSKNKGNQVTNYGHNFNPILSPDKTKIAFLSVTKESLNTDDLTKRSTNVWIINIDGKSPIQVSRHIDSIDRSNLHWLDNNTLLYTEGDQTIKKYSLLTKASEILAGPEKPIRTCIPGDCGYENHFLYSPDFHFLIRLSDGYEHYPKSVILDLQNFKSYTIDDVDSVMFDTLSFSDDNRKLTYEGFKLPSEDGKTKYFPVTINLDTHKKIVN